MKNILKKIDEANFSGKVVYDKNPDKPMFYFEFVYKNNSVFISFESIIKSLYFGIDKNVLPPELFSWLNDNFKIDF